MEKEDGFVLFLCNLDNSYLDNFEKVTRKKYLNKLFLYLETERKKTNSERILWCFYSNEFIDEIKKSITEVEDCRPLNSNIVIGKTLCPSFDYSFEAYEKYVIDGIDISKRNVFFYLNKYYNYFISINKVFIADNDLLIPDEMLSECFTCEDICLLDVVDHENKLRALCNCFVNNKRLIYKEEHY